MKSLGARERTGRKERKILFCFHYIVHISLRSFSALGKHWNRSGKSVCCVWTVFRMLAFVICHKAVHTKAYPRTPSEEEKKNWCDFDGDIVVCDGWICFRSHEHIWCQCVGLWMMKNEQINFPFCDQQFTPKLDWGSSLIIISLFIGKWCWVRQSILRLVMFCSLAECDTKRSLGIYCLLIEVYIKICIYAFLLYDLWIWKGKSG